MSRSINVITGFIDGFLEAFSKIPPKKWNYEDGCLVLGAISLFRLTGKEFYKDFAIRYYDRYITETGEINFYEKETYNIDSILSGRGLFFAYAETNEEKYKTAIEALKNQLRSHPRAKNESYWHKKIYPDQIWLDGLFMAEPFCAMYEKTFYKKGYYDDHDILMQFENVRKYMFNSEKGLFYHAYDEERVQPWADKKTGCSPNFWLRSMGWFLMALVDTIEEADGQNYEFKARLIDIYKEAVKGILKYQDKATKLFYQIIDRADLAGNYIETSGSLMIACSIIKACRFRVLLPEKYLETGVEIFYSIVREKLVNNSDGVTILADICSVAGLGPGNKRDGSTDYYLSEKVVSNDLKGVAAFILAYAQLKLAEAEIGGDFFETCSHL